MRFTILKTIIPRLLFNELIVRLRSGYSFVCISQVLPRGGTKSDSSTLPPLSIDTNLRLGPPRTP